MRTIALLVAVAFLPGAALATFCTPTSVTSTSPGKNSVSSAGTNLLMPLLSPTSILSGTISKGKKKSVVNVQATVTVFGNAIVYDIQPQVNGVIMNGPDATTDCKFTSATSCTLSGNWWLDVDAAETAHPGQFVGQPLVIQLLAESQSASFGDGCGYGSLAAQQVKK